MEENVWSSRLPETGKGLRVLCARLVPVPFMLVESAHASESSTCHGGGTSTPKSLKSVPSSGMV